MNYLLKILPLFLLTIFLSSCTDQLTDSVTNNETAAKDIFLVYGDITPEEAEGLIYIRQEEKVARDVYTILGETWPVNVFNKIKLAEQKHMDAVKVLLTRYEIEDPVSNDEVGVFNNPEFQQMFDDFIELGQQSLTDAFVAGKTIEEQDIAYLENQLTFVDNQDIIKVYTNLKIASERHLAAFTTHTTYSPY